VVGPEATQLALLRADLLVEQVDQPQARLERGAPRLGDLESVQQLPARAAEQVGDGTRLVSGDQRGVDAVLERRPLVHQMQAEAGPLACI